MGQNCQTNLEKVGSPFTPETSGFGRVTGTGTGGGIAYGIRGTEVDPDEKQDPQKRKSS